MTLVAPDFEQEVTAPLDVIGTVNDDNLADWTLYLIEANAPPTEFTVLATDTNEITNGVLGQVDPTQLLNGLYQVVLEAEDLSGNVVSDSRTIRVTGDLKVGNFSVTFEDISVPVADIPVFVSRTYDSRQRDKRLDFGHGWSIDYQNVRLQESRDIGFSWTITQERFGFFGQTCVRPNGNPTVTVTLPDGHVESFVARAEPECQFAAQPFVNIHFDPIDGTDSTLTQETFGLVRIINNNLVDPGQPDVPVDPSSYTLTTPEGLVYELDQSFGIRRITDSHDSTITFDANGITHSAGFALQFVRDVEGRITDIVAPDGSTLSYGYDSAGDLVSFTDQALQTTTYTYLAGVDHYLEDIVDPRGITVARNEYDPDGRLVAHIDADGNRIEYTHNIAGRTETIRDRRGNATVYVYDDEGNVLAETNALGETITRTYDTNRNVLSEANPLGHTMTWTYDDRGNQLTETNALGETTTSTYDTRNLLLTQADAVGNTVIVNTYDTRNTNLLTSTDALLNTTTFLWDSGIGSGCSTGASRGVTNALGDTRVSQPICAGPLSGLTRFDEDERGVRTTYDYDTLGRRISETTSRTDENGIVRTLVTSFVYDDRGRVVSVTDPNGNVTLTEYNGIDKESATVDALGRRTEYVYDARGNLTETHHPDGTVESSEYDPEGNVVAQTDRSGNTTRMAYDAANRLIETIHPDATPGNLLDNPRTLNEYDAAGRLTATVDENGNRTEYEYDNAGRQTLVRDALGNETAHEYDARGLRTATVDALGRRTEFVYDAAGRLIETLHPVPAPNDRTQTFYDALGRKTGEMDLAGEVTDFEYDETGNLTAVVDALGGRTEYGYDEQGDKIAQTDAEGRTTTWAYDDLGRVTSRTLPLGQAETFSYDAVSNRSGMTDFNGLTTTYAYDLADRQSTISHGDGRTTSMTYTGTGQLASVTDSRGTTTYTYDARDRLLSVTQPDGRTIDYGYDPAGNRIALDTSNQSVAYAYDTLNRLQTVTDASGTTTYAYDAVGNRASVTHANGSRAVYSYDDLNRLTELTNEDAVGGILSRHTYTLGPAGNRTGLAETLLQPDGSTVTRDTSYTYDALYRLTDESVVDVTNGSRTTSWSYDAVGSRLSETRTGVSAGTTNYAYDLNDRLLTASAPGETTTYTYDAAGNTVMRSVNGLAVAVLDYDSDNRLIQSTSIGGTTTVTDYAYDASGIRQSETTAGVTTLFLVDPNRDYAQVIEEQVGAALERLYTYGDDLIRQTRAGASADTYLYDGLGSTRLLTDNSGNVTDTYVFHAFGETEVQNGSTPNDYLYTGEQFDPNVGFYYLRARYMDPAVGRFVGMDSFAGFMHEPLSLQKYLYGHANPVDNLDPSGNTTLTGLSAGQAGLISIALRTSVPLLRHAVAACVGVAVASTIVSTDALPEPAARCQGNQMRVQFQMSPISGGITLNTHASAIFGLGRGVTVAQVEAKMRHLFYTLPNWWPGRLESDAIGLMARQSIVLRRQPPLGVPPGWTHKEFIRDRRLEYRIDVESLRGRNLTRFH